MYLCICVFMYLCIYVFMYFCTIIKSSFHFNHFYLSFANIHMYRRFDAKTYYFFFGFVILILFPIALTNWWRFFSLLLYCSHSLFSLCWWALVPFLTRFLGSSPHSFLRMLTETSIASFCKQATTVHRDGLAWPTRCLKLLFHDSHLLFVLSLSSIVASCTFHTGGGNLGGILRKRRLILLGITNAFMGPVT